MRRTVTRLADGRDLLYFDDGPGGRGRTAADRRPLPPPGGGSEVRVDPLLDEPVVVAAYRQDRTFLPPAGECPLCPSSAGRATEIPAEAYDVVVFENRWPSFTERGGGRGRCEVICFTDDHDATLASLPPARLRTVVDAWADRTEALGRRADVEAVACFENRGEEIGVTLTHPHGQIYGYPFVPPTLRRMLASARARRDVGGHLFAELLAAERQARRRIVTETAGWTGFVPYAARWPFEVHLYPDRQVPDLTSLDDVERAGLAAALPDLLGRFDRLFERPMPYIAAWYQAPVRADRDLHWLHLRVFSSRRAPDRLKYLAGSESAYGAFIVDVAPERAAEMLRSCGP